MNTLLNLEICLSQCQDTAKPLTKASGLKNYFVTISEDMRDIGTYRLIRLMQSDSGDVARLHIPDKFMTGKEIFLEFWTSDDAGNNSNIMQIGTLIVHQKDQEIHFKASHPNEYIGMCHTKNMHKFILNESPTPYSICLNTASV